MAIRLFRCRICGDPYLGEEKPSNCPFCGASEEYLVDGAEWKEENKGVQLTEASKANLEKALELEIGNTNFYSFVAGTAKDAEVSGVFKALSKVEHEHAVTISKLLGVERPLIGGMDAHPKSDEESFRETLEREQRAVQEYTKFLSEATEERVKYFFKALMEIESTHIDLAKDKLK